MFVIAGVTGNTGKAAAEALLARGQKVRVLVRDAAKGEPWKAKGAEVAVGDLDDVGALTRALEGATGAYLLIPPGGWSESGGWAKSLFQGGNLVEAVRRAKVPHTVLLSSIAVQVPSGVGPINRITPIERAFRSAGLKATFLRAAYFQENLGSSIPMVLEKGVYATFSVDKPVDMVATKDIGEQAAHLLVEPHASGIRVIELAGPKTYTQTEVAAAFASVTGKPVALQTFPIEGMVPMFMGMHASQELAEGYADMTRAMNDGRIGWEGGSAIFVRGKTGLETTIAGLIKR